MSTTVYTVIVSSLWNQRTEWGQGLVIRIVRVSYGQSVPFIIFFLQI